jgi:hypothetical protein
VPQPTRTVCVGALSGKRKSLPSKRTDTLSVVETRVRLLNVTRLRYVQSGWTSTLRVEMVEVPLLNRTVTLPLHRSTMGGGTQYAVFVTPGAQRSGTQLPAF